MKKYIAILLLLITTNAHSNCVFNLNANDDIGEFIDALRCLQDEINLMKGQSSDNAQKSKNRYYTIQIIATSNLNHAEEIRETFKTFGYDAFIKLSLNTINPERKIFYKVMLGKHKWKSEAVQEKSILIANHPIYKNSFVRSIILDE